MKEKYTHRPNDGGLQFGHLSPTEGRRSTRAPHITEMKAQESWRHTWSDAGKAQWQRERKGKVPKHRDGRRKGSEHHADKARHRFRLMEDLPSPIGLQFI